MRAFTVPLLIVVGISAVGFAAAPSAGKQPATMAKMEQPRTSRPRPDDLKVYDRTLAAHMTLSVLEDAARQGIIIDAPVPMAAATRDYRGL